jgi:hypothetical protein
MRRFSITTRCECQAKLGAIVDEQRNPVEGTATRRGVTLRAPAHSIGPDSERFDVGWLCPFCGRNTLRSIDAGSLRLVRDDGATTQA